jgi:hypothetical protein
MGFIYEAGLKTQGRTQLHLIRCNMIKYYT